MMPVIINVETDLRPFAPDIDTAKATLMIADALAIARLVAPCIDSDDFPHIDAAKAIIRGAILRWNDAGTGAAVQMGAGPFQQTMDTRQPRRSMFFPSEINDLERLCLSTARRKAFMIDLMPIEGNL